MDEFSMIRRLTRGRTGKEGDGGRRVAVGIGDDAAVVVPTPGMQTVLTCDTMVEIVDFLPWTMDDESIGWKAMAQNVSDLAAMGAQPRHALVALSAPKRFPVERLSRIYEGLYACADRYGITVIGGDMSEAPERVSVTVTAVGEVEAGRALLRSGARPGDVVFVTGPLGLSAAGLHWMLRGGPQGTEAVPPRGECIQGSERWEPGSGEWAPLVAAHRRPEPRVAAGRALLGLAHSLNDVSDGLAREAAEIAEASGVRIVLEEAALPVHADLAAYAAQAGADPLRFLLEGGEDYELVGTAPAERAQELLAALRACSAEPAIVGTVREGEPGVELLRPDGSAVPLARRGYTHFDGRGGSGNGVSV